MQGTDDVQLLASMPRLKKLVVHSLLPDAPIAPPCAWEDLWIVSFNGDLRRLSRLPLTGLEALRLGRCVISVDYVCRSIDPHHIRLGSNSPGRASAAARS